MTSEINKDKDFASDTEESDEDFHPNETGESAVSEEESDGFENEEVNQAGVDDNDDGDGDESSRQKKKNVRKGKKLTKKAVKKKKSKSNDDSAEDEVDNGNGKLSRTRRTTRQTEDPYTNGQKKSLEKDELESDGEDKSRENALWADFLKDVGPPSTKTTKAVTQIKPSTSSSTNGKVNVDVALKKHAENKTDQDMKKVSITEVLDFAGEEVRIQKEVDISSIKENKATATAAPKLQPFGRIMPGAGIKRVIVAGSSKGGLGSILNKITKKQKISVLDKSQMDWKSFKQEEGIDETLQTYNKGKDGYLERQDFLQRTDVRQFEIEKNLRQTSRRPH